MEKKLLRDPNNRLLGGVSSGIGNYLGCDANIIRLLWIVVSLIVWGFTPLIYALLWILIPKGEVIVSENGTQMQPTKSGCLGTFLKVSFGICIFFILSIAFLVVISIILAVGLTIFTFFAGLLGFSIESLGALQMLF